DPMASTGGLTGRVVFAGGPLSGIQVVLALSGVADPDTIPPPARKARSADAEIEALVPGKTAVTGADGRFTIAGLHPCRYAVHAAARMDDGYGGDSRDTNRVTPAQTVDVGDVAVVAAMTPFRLLPTSNLAVDQPIVLLWTSPPLPFGVHVIDYRLQFGTGYILINDVTLTQTSFSLGVLPPRTAIRWFVDARGVVEATGDTIQVGAFEEIASFTVAAAAR